MDRETDWLGDVVKIALGIFLGGVLLWAAAEYRARYELRQLERSVEQSTREIQRAATIEREQRERQRKAIDALKRDQAVKASVRQQERAAAERAKHEAWQRFYQPSAECIRASSVECGNAHIRARREFERLYAAGQL